MKSRWGISWPFERLPGSIEGLFTLLRSDFMTFIHSISPLFFLCVEHNCLEQLGPLWWARYRCVYGTVFISERYWFVFRAVRSFRILSVICSVMLSPNFLLSIQLNLYVHFPGAVVSLFHCTKPQPVGYLTLISIFIKVTALPPCLITPTEMLVVGKLWNL